MPLRAWLSVRVASLGLLASFVTGCGTVGNCDILRLRSYDDAFVKRFYSETAAIPDNSAVGAYLVDAFNLRNDVAACKGYGALKL